MIVASVLFVPTFFAVTSAAWGIGLTAIYIALVVALRFYKPSGWSDKPMDAIEINGDSLVLNGRTYPRSTIGTFFEFTEEYRYLGSKEEFDGIQIRINITDIRLNCSFPPHRHYERIEVLRLLNSALERIPPKSTAPQSQPEMASDEPDIYL